MVCFACGQDLPDAARFCSQCGTNLRGVAVRPTIETTIAATNKTKTEVTAEIIDDGNFKEEDVRAEYTSLPFEFDIIENFRKQLPSEYKSHVRKRLGEALEDQNISYSTIESFYKIMPLELWDYPSFYHNINTVGDLAFFFIKINKRLPFLKPTTQMLMELLVRVYMKG